MNQPKRLLIMAGGSGGHIFPGLVIANYLKLQGWDIFWLGVIDKMEADLVPKYGFKINFIENINFCNKNIRTLLISSIKIIQAIKQAKIIIQNCKPDIVLGMGGYVTGPGSIAAWLYNIPIVIHEQNVVAGLTNRLLKIIAKRVLQGFPGAFPDSLVVGNPVREEILSIPKPEERFIKHTGAIRILVIGGSQGAKILNETLPNVAASLGKKIIIWHQVGKYNQEITENLYKKLCIKLNNYKITEFIHNMNEAYSWADIIICRAGALTISEISIVGLPAILVPLQHKDQHQYLNALLLEKIGAAKIIKQSYFSATKLINILKQWSRLDLLEMGKKAQTISTINSTKLIANILIKLAK